MHRFLLFTLISGAILFGSCKQENKVVAPIKIEFEKEGELSIHHGVSDSIVATFDIEIANSDYEHQTGLMNRHSMEDHQAMLFIFPDVQLRSFYMKNTYLSLDIIYFDGDGKLINIQSHTNPLDNTSILSEAPAKFVLEIKAGLSERFNLQKGDRIEYTEVQ